MRLLTLAGWKRQHGDKDMLSNWRSPHRPSEKSPEQGRTYNRRNREVGRRREGGGGSSDEAEQCPWSEGALPLATSPTEGRQGRDDKGVHRFAGPEAEDIRQGEG